MNGDGFIGRLSSRMGSGTRSLLSSAGKARGGAAFEALEPRVLLSGDNPGFDDVFPAMGAGVDPTLITVNADADGDGVFDRGFATGQIGDVADDTGDFFRFTAPVDGYVTVLAQAFPLATTVNTRVEVYLPDGTELTSDTEGLNNGTLSRGFSQDGQYGFVADMGQEYYVRVVAENLGSLPVGAGVPNYTLWVNAGNRTIAPLAGVAGAFTTGSDTGDADDHEIITLLEDQLFTFTTGATDSLGYVLAGDVAFGDDGNGYIGGDPSMIDRDLFDSRVEVYDSTGALVGSDSDSGYIWDAYALVRFEANSTYYVRVRSDAPSATPVTDPQTATNDDVAIGTFELRVQTQATDVALDLQTRVGVVDRSSSGQVIQTGLPGGPTDAAGLLRDQHSAQVFTFESLGEGRAFVNFFTFGDMMGMGAHNAILDTTMSLFDESGSVVPIRTNDTLITGDGYDRPGIEFDAEGGERYYVVVDGFDGIFRNTGDPASDVQAGQFDYRLLIENAVLDESDPTQRVDDHIDFTGTDTDGDGIADVVNQRVIDFATPLIWGNAVTPNGYIDGSSTLGPDNNGNGVPDGYIFPGLLDPAFSNPVTDHTRVVQAFADGRLDNPNDTDVFTFVPQVDMLGSHTGSIDLTSGVAVDGNPPGQTWFINGRPASRLTVNVYFEAEWFAFGGSAIQVFDSNFDLVDEAYATPVFSVLQGNQPAGSLATPAGAQSPSLLPPGPEAGSNVDSISTAASITLDSQYWAGESYYIVVSAPLGESRYNMIVQADAFDRDNTQYAFDADTAEEGDFGNAQELVFDGISGVATNNNNPNNTGDLRTIPSLVADVFIDDMMDPDFGQPDPMGDGFFDNYDATGQLGLIHDVNDTDIYRFTAASNGTAEILISTTQLSDSFQERFRNSTIAGNPAVDVNNLTKTYNSPLDAAFRVYNSSGVQVAYVDDYLGYTAEGQTLNFSNSGQGANVGDIQVSRKDPRLVIDVVQGEQYFVVVESSQRWASNAEDADISNRVASQPGLGQIDYRRATGSYQLVVNTTPNQTGFDDHDNGDFGRQFQATVVPFDSDPDSPTNGQGGVSGVIEQTNDIDVFEFMAPATGIAQLILDPSAALSLSLSLFDGDTTFIPLTNSTALGGELLIVNFAANQGERYYFQVAGLSGTGSYDVSISNLPVEDDRVGEGRYAAATPLSFGDFDRTISTTAEIEQAGDSEIYRFASPETGTLTITLAENGSPTFAGAVEIYEQTMDPSGAVDPLSTRPVQNHFLIGYELNADGDATIQTTVSTQANRTYYVVVRGANPTTTRGLYELTLSYNPEDDHADIGELADASFVNVVPSTGTGSITGVLEQSSDSDLFVFGAPAAGPVEVTLAWTSAPPAAFSLRIFDVNGNAIDADMNGNPDIVTGTGGTLMLPSVEASPGDIFYVAVTGPNATDIGYTLTVNTGLLDDHANQGDLANATLIPLSPVTGDGASSGRLEVDDDTDLFTFSVSDGGTVDVLVTSSEITTPVIRVFDSAGVLVTSTPITGGSRFTNSTGADSVFYVSVSSTFPGFRSGTYSLAIDGPPAPPSPNDDHVDDGDFMNATDLTVSTITGDASASGVINAALDSDLFRYVTTGRGDVFAQVVSADSPSPDFSIRVFDASGTELTGLADSAGVAGARGVTASTVLDSTGAGQTFFLLVESTGDSDIGNYSLNLDGAAATSVLFYPEGFANASIQEYVTLANPNAESVDYTIRVYYADVSLPSAVVATGTLAAGARGGATLSYGGDIDGDGNADFATGIIANEAYAISIESELRIGASLSHYDRGILSSALDPSGLDRTPGAIGEVFTDRLSNSWAFPDIERNPGVSEEYLVYFNPNPFSVDVVVTAFTPAGEISLSAVTLGANRRGGVEIHNTAAFPLGTFAVEVTSSATNSANEAANLGIVASVSRYNTLDLTAYGYLGVADGGSTVNVVTSLTEGPSIDSEINLFNAGDSAATVTITGSYLSNSGLPDLVRTFTLGAGQRFTLTGQNLAFVPNTPIGLTLASTSAIAVSTVETQRGDATATAAFTESGNSFFFGDAFLNPTQAGTLYSEALTLYNPGSADADVSVTFRFADGSAARVRMETVQAEGFLRLQLESLAEVVNNRPRLNFFSIQVDSDSALVAQLSHFDGFLGGGWSTGGAALGLTNSIA